MDISVLHNSILFKGFDDTEISELLKALNAAERKYNKGAMIFSSGEITDKLCFVTAGSVTVESNDMWGNRTILNLVGKGQFFAESYALLPDVPMLVDVYAAEDCSIVHYSVCFVNRLSTVYGLFSASTKFLPTFSSSAFYQVSTKILQNT